MTLPIVRMLTFGLRMTPGPVASIQAGSIAEKAGFKKGDRIVKVDGRDDFDPIRLPSDLFHRAGKPTTFVVERTTDGKSSPVELTATPDDSLPDFEPILDPLDALKIPGLGLAIDVEAKVAGVAKDSPAEKAGIAPGAVLSAMTIPPETGTKKGTKPRALSFAKTKEKGVVEARWPYVFGYLQATERREMQVTLQLQAHHRLSVTGETEMAGLDDAGVDGPDRDLVQGVALDRQEVVGRRRVVAPAAVVQPGAFVGQTLRLQAEQIADRAFQADRRGVQAADRRVVAGGAVQAQAATVPPASSSAMCTQPISAQVLSKVVSPATRLSIACSHAARSCAAVIRAAPRRAGTRRPWGRAARSRRSAPAAGARTAGCRRHGRDRRGRGSGRTRRRSGAAAARRTPAAGQSPAGSPAPARARRWR